MPQTTYAKLSGADDDDTQPNLSDDAAQISGTVLDVGAFSHQGVSANRVHRAGLHFVREKLG